MKGATQDIWSFRFYEIGPDGKRHYNRVRIGPKAQYPTESAAREAVEGLKLSANKASRFRPSPVLINSLIDRYLREELPERASTRFAYSSLLRCWIKPKWGNIVVDQLKALLVEHWLKSLELSPKTKANIRNLMHVLYECARRWELADKNPIELVRQSARRRETPRRLSIEEMRLLIARLEEPHRTMVVLACCLGLRIGEILGLQWGDVDLMNGALSIRRSVYQYHIGPTKTPNSEAALPIAPEILFALRQWHAHATYQSVSDFVFASSKGGPKDADRLRQDVLQPAALHAGLGAIGWHTLRHSYATALDIAGARMKVAQELMRHANITTTMDVYTGVMDRDKRETAGRVAAAVLGQSQ
ncbi:MAG: tyrosine-type recombinase/integrase [Terriglobia bacterium]